MLRWNNDYNRGAHPDIIEAFARYNDVSYGGYGKDEWCEKGAEAIRKYLGGVDADIHFLIGGTQANFTIIGAALRPYQGVISADSGHINVHETGAIENTGHKILAIPHKEGKISADAIEAVARDFRESEIQEHITMPKLVFLSFPTEYGTIYSKKELTDIRAVCDEYNMYLHIDGARLGYGLGAADCDLSLAELASLADVFYIGGTKCGAMFGEAAVIINPEIKVCFRSHMKQNGAMLAKGWTLGLQYYTLFENGLYFDITKRADELAMEIKAAFAKKGIPSYIDSCTNQQFVLLNKQQVESLEKNHIYELEFRDGDTTCVRFCTSWSSRKEDVDILVQDILAL